MRYLLVYIAAILFSVSLDIFRVMKSEGGFPFVSFLFLVLSFLALLCTVYYVWRKNKIQEQVWKKNVSEVVLEMLLRNAETNGRKLEPKDFPELIKVIEEEVGHYSKGIDVCTFLYNIERRLAGGAKGYEIFLGKKVDGK